MRKLALLAVPFLALTACGSDPVPGPTEQIIVREPGAAPVAPAAGEQLSEADTLLAAGKAAFAGCVACHSVVKGETGAIGANLHGVVDRAAGSLADATYSDALKASGITWTAAELDAFLIDPAAKVPGTTMTVGAVADADQRTAIIAYLKDLSAS